MFETHTRRMITYKAPGHPHDFTFFDYQLITSASISLWFLLRYPDAGVLITRSNIIAIFTLIELYLILLPFSLQVAT